MNTEKQTLGDMMFSLLGKHPESRDDLTFVFYLLADCRERIAELEKELQEMELDRDCWKERY
jgi:hypothetical protein